MLQCKVKQTIACETDAMVYRGENMCLELSLGLALSNEHNKIIKA